MAQQVQLRRGTTTQHASFTGALGEVTVDVTKKTAVVHDGSTVGGFPLAQSDQPESFTTLDLAAGTITASDPVIDGSQTWNDGAITFTALKVAITDTASAADSLLLDLQVGGSSIFNIRKEGWINDTLFVDEANNRVGIGIDTPYAQLVVRSQNTGNTRGIAVEHVDNTTAFSQAKFVGRRSRGSHGSPSAVLANDSLVSFNGAGYKASTWSDTVGGLYIYARENWTDTATGTFITLRGPKPGTTTPQEWARFQSDAAQFTPEWTAAGTTYTALKVNPTNTASAAASLLLDLQVGGSSKLSVNKSGDVTMTSFAELPQITAPSTPAGTTCRIYAKDNGSGLTQLVVLMPDGVETVLATET
jgi:hypothetical protein